MEYSHRDAHETDITIPIPSAFPSETPDMPNPMIDEDTMSEIYREHGSWMYRIAQRQVGWPEAQDIAQKAWVRLLDESGQRALENAGDLPKGARPLIHTIIKNLVADYYNNAYNRRIVSLNRGVPTQGAEYEGITEEYEPQPNPSAEDEGLIAMQQDGIHELLGKVGEKLFPREKALIEGIIIDGQRYAEYAEEHGITETMAKNQIYKLRQKIRRVFGEDFDELDLE
ncbi:MAG TPA: sigma-70 family RNA polymerase sigma factor [Candidatus Saccharimonadales bacterium]|jgi:RNA polymerase sigma factor (sigma-70 family)|nr:sigma-70 family RNA polymerase sigma factor [Candidatus Saccharimonadales bacterium]